MSQENRQRLLEMVRGDDGRVPLWRICFDGNPPREPEYIDGSEVDKLFDDIPSEDGRVEYRLLFGCPDEAREEVLSDKPCLVRQPDGRFLAQNVGKEGPVYIVE